MGHVHTKSNSYALTRVTDQIIGMSLSGVCLNIGSEYSRLCVSEI